MNEVHPTITLRCDSWHEVETFCDQKLSLGETIETHVRFYAAPDSVVQFALELPNDIVIAFDTRVVASAKTPTGSVLNLTLVGSNRPLVRKLRALIDDSLMPIFCGLRSSMTRRSAAHCSSAPLGSQPSVINPIMLVRERLIRSTGWLGAGW